MYEVYAKRWFVLVVVCALNATNAMTWITFAPIASITNSFYDNSNAATFLNVIYMVISIPMGIVALWSVDHYGIRVTCISGSLINLLGNCLRLAGSTKFINGQASFWIVLFGQAVAAIAQPFIMYLPTKIAAVWFPQNERLLCNTLATMSNPFGVAAMYLIAPELVKTNEVKSFVMLTGIIAGLTLITFILSLEITSSKPKNPPSAIIQANSENASQIFWSNLKTIFKNKTFLVLCTGVGSGVGLFNCLYNNLQPALCSLGYSERYIALVGAGMILFGVLGSGIISLVVGKWDCTLGSYRACLAITAGNAAALAYLMKQRERQYWLAAFVLGFGFFGFPIYPIGLEMAVEDTFPVPEAMTSGFLILFGQIFGIIYIVTTVFSAQDPSAEILETQTCNAVDDTIDIQDWKVSQYIWSGTVIVTCLITIALLKPKFKRRKFEQNNLYPKITQ